MPYLRFNLEDSFGVVLSLPAIHTSAILAEEANTEAQQNGGRVVGHMDLEELQATAMLYFGAIDMLAAIYGDRPSEDFHPYPPEAKRVPRSILHRFLERIV